MRGHESARALLLGPGSAPMPAREDPGESPYFLILSLFFVEEGVSVVTIRHRTLL
jgi:hypothetical protein